MCAEDQATAGISTRLLRLSVGIEHVDDLLADLAAGFEALRRRRENGKVRKTGAMAYSSMIGLIHPFMPNAVSSALRPANDY
jgi:hypothetical protein